MVLIVESKHHFAIGEAALSLRTMPTFIASGRSGQAATSEARSG